MDNIFDEVKNAFNVELRPFQCQVIKYLSSHNKDVIFSCPIGYGKTFCFRFLPFIFNKIMTTDSSIIVVISPFIYPDMCCYLEPQPCLYGEVFNNLTPNKRNNPKKFFKNPKL